MCHVLAAFKPLPLVLAVLLPLQEAAAQATAVVPAARAASEGNSSSHFPFVYDAGRFQMVVEGSAFTSSLALLNGFSMRREGVSNETFQAISFPRMVVTVGHAASGVDPAGMSTTFAANRGPSQTIVFDAAFNLPPLPPAGAPAPFNLNVLFSTQFIYQRAMGNLLIEVEFPGQAALKREYLVDAEQYRGTAGTAAAFGASGPVNAGDRLVASVVSRNLMPGGTVETSLVGMTQAYPLLHWLGSGSNHFGGVPLPLDLAGVGAPGNFLYCNLTVVTSSTATGSGSVFRGTGSWPIPNDPALAGAQVFFQWGVVDPPSNALGLVTTNAYAVTIAPGSTAPVPLNSIQASESARPDGFFLYGQTGAGGPVVLLRGVFG